MNAIIIKNMEAVFAVAVSFSLAAVFFTTEAPVIEVNVSGPVAAHVVSAAAANA